MNAPFACARMHSILRLALALGAGAWVGLLRAVLLLSGYVYLPSPWKLIVLLMPLVFLIVACLVRRSVGVLDVVVTIGTASVLIVISLPVAAIYSHMVSRCLHGDGFACHGAAVIQDRYLDSSVGRSWVPRDRVDELLRRACELGCQAGCRRALVMHHRM